MTRFEVHQELALLGVCSEIHALVDDLDLDIGSSTLSSRQIINSRLNNHKDFKPICKNVYQPKTIFEEVPGRFGEEFGDTMRKVRRVSCKEAERVCSSQLPGSRDKGFTIVYYVDV